MKKRNIFLLILCFILTLSLCGCTKQEYEVLIHDNDNVDFTIKISVDKEQYDLLSTFDVTLEDLEANKVNSTNTTVDKVNVLFQEIAMLYNTYGFNITPINDSKEIGFIAKKTYMTIEEFNAEIEKFAQGKISGLNLKIDYTK